MNKEIHKSRSENLTNLVSILEDLPKKYQKQVITGLIEGHKKGVLEDIDLKDVTPVAYSIIKALRLMERQESDLSYKETVLQNANEKLASLEKENRMLKRLLASMLRVEKIDEKVIPETFLEDSLAYQIKIEYNKKMRGLTIKLPTQNGR